VGENAAKMEGFRSLFLPGFGERDARPEWVIGVYRLYGSVVYYAIKCGVKGRAPLALTSVLLMRCPSSSRNRRSALWSEPATAGARLHPLSIADSV